ncbi:AAA family ATPase [Billgrantia ethanolica]|uniref:AAA family ATPase n=1 Tax=Billgrantia ethanolica TaxID=2733486 RepID=A0ABS9A605_9GAMM|nr:AAA family ATPase [Halomonas ethanolica]MCE8004259.1 AAA family ATPase [Halomonas ethanolica]
MTDNVTQLGNRFDQQLLAEVRQVMKSEGLSQSQVSSQSGVSKTRLNHWLAEKYTGSIAPIETDLKRWLESRRANADLQERLPGAPEWVETPSARSVISALAFAQMAEAVSVVYGGAGVGKTLAIRQYREQAPNVWVVTATPASSAPGSILTRIAQVLGIRASGAVHVVEANIIERLRDTRGLLVIDEAQHLTSRALDAVRSLHDAAGVGLALVGNEVVYAQLTGGSRSVGFAQLFSRIAKRVRLSRPQASDIDALLDAWSIASADARRVCHEIGRRPGALRGLSQTLRLASLFASGQPGTEHIRAAWKDLGGEA